MVFFPPFAMKLQRMGHPKLGKGGPPAHTKDRRRVDCQTLLSACLWSWFVLEWRGDRDDCRSQCRRRLFAASRLPNRHTRFAGKLPRHPRHTPRSPDCRSRCYSPQTKFRIRATRKKSKSAAPKTKKGLKWSVTDRANIIIGT